MRNVVKQWESDRETMEKLLRSDRETVRKRRKNLQLLDNRFSTASLLFSGSSAIASQLLFDCFATVFWLFCDRFTIASQPLNYCLTP